ncbi:MAG TPA: EamA family transporter RarD [Caulobacteraceae bacterium]|nr:EamA family transporter RarD [Caulobacteraceae bacterium]
MTRPAAPAPGPARGAVVAGVASYLIWGLLPIYLAFAARAGAGSLEIMAHRALWSTPWAAAIVLASGQARHTLAVLKAPRTLGWLALSAALIAANWLLFIWSVTNGHALEASLGYYINPLVNMALGAVLFRERLNVLAKAAIAFAAAGVVVQTIALGQLPLVSLALALTFTGYGLIRKQVAAEAQTGLLVECLLLAPLALGLVLWLQASGAGHFLASPTAFWLLLAAGPMTVLPLALFAWSARRLPLSAVGFLQFIGPSLQFVFGVETGEHLTMLSVAAFGLIWIGAGLFVFGALRAARRARPSLNQPPKLA